MSQRCPDVLSMIRTLVKHSSVSSTDPSIDQSNLKVVDTLAEWLEQLGFQIEIQPVSERKSNLIATLGEAKHRNGLVLSGHTDTVPYDEPAWSTNPLEVTERDNRLYGLGTADMKSFFAMVLEAVSDYSPTDLSQPVVVLATADEESTMAGAKLLADKGIALGRYAVVGEPTNLRPIRMHKGVMMESIVIHGKAGHSSNPSLGANALEGMHSVLTKLLAWRADLQKKNRNPIFDVEYPTLNLGVIHGGDNPNRICARCETQIDIRPLPGMDLDELRRDLRQLVESALEAHPQLSFTLKPLFSGLPSFETPGSSEIVRACEKLSNFQAGAVAFGTEAPYFSGLGTETVVLGPGSIDQAHQADEFLPMAHIAPTIRIVRKLIDRFCATASSA